MSTRRLIETTVKLIKTAIETNIASKLAAVSTDRNDFVVPLPPPESYFFYPRAAGYRPPAVFIIAEGFDKEKPRGANHISAKVDVHVNVVIEELNRDNLLLSAWRYQAALDEILDQTELEDSAQKVKIVILVSKCEFSPEYTESDDPENSMAVFRKEVSLQLEVHHFEGF